MVSGTTSGSGFLRARAAAPPTPPTAAAPKNASLYSRIASSPLSERPACQRSAICSSTSVGDSATIPSVAPVAARVPTFAPVRLANSEATSLLRTFSGTLLKPRVNRSAKYPSGAVTAAVAAALPGAAVSPVAPSSA